MTVKFGFQPDTRVTINGQTVAEWGATPGPVQSLAALGGRLNVIEGALSAPSLGTAVPRPGGKTSLALWDVRKDTTITATLDGNPVEIAVSKPLQERVFASGKHYWLAQDPVTGRFKPEPGRNHRKIYLSGSASAMTRAMIAAHAGIPVSAVTGAWLLARPQYGGSESMPVAIDVWLLLLPVLQQHSLPGCSAWVRLERGPYEYALTAPGGIKGESELHPFVVETWGTGQRPFLASGGSWTTQPGPRYMLIRDVEMRLMRPYMGFGVIFENCVIQGAEEYNQLRGTGMATLRECVICDVSRSVPGEGRESWDGSKDRCSGLFASGAEDIMLDSLLVDLNGWREGYDYNRSGSMPMPPSDRNHGLYLTFTNHNVHVRDSFISRNSSCGIQARMGGTFERVLYADNNVAGGLNSGSNMGAINHYTNVLDNVAFGAGFKRVNGYQGALNWGIVPTGPHASMIGCIVAHVANPDDPAEVADRTGGSNPYKGNHNYFYNDTQVYKWLKKDDSWTNERVEGIAPATLDQTTLHRYAATLLKQSTASINDLVEYLRDDTEAQIGKTVRDVIRWTKARFGSPLPALRSTPGNPTFQPDPRTDGFRWDNRLNWTTLDLPGTHVADSVDLAGNFVRFGTVCASIAALKSGGGTLDVTSGKLTAGSITDALKATVNNSGQIVLPAMTQALDLKASGGRTILTGAVSNLALEARGNAEVLLGPDATIPAGKSLIISGQRTMVGWDGTGSASLKVDGTLEFRPGTAVKLVNNDQWWNKQPLFLPGNEVIGPNFSAILSDYEEGRALYLSDLVGMPQLGEVFRFGFKIETSDTQNEDIPQYATIDSIISRSFSPLRVFRSGSIGDGTTEPTVAATLLLRAGSAVKVDATGLSAGTHDLTGPGVTVTNQGATLPAGVSVTGGKLVLTVS